MVDELIVRASLIADLLEAGINPDKYFRSQQGELSPDELSPDELCLARQFLYAKQLEDAFLSYQKGLRELQEASDNAKEHLTALHYTRPR